MNISGIEYLPGQFRGENGENMVTHLYTGDFSNPGFPMCSRGWQRKWFDKDGKIEDYEYSIFRNNVSRAGLCKVCLRRADEGRKPVEVPANKRRHNKNDKIA